MFAIVCFYHRMSGINLFNMAVDFTQMLLLSAEILLALSHDGKHDDKSNQARSHCRQCHPPVCDKHHNKASGK